MLTPVYDHNPVEVIIKLRRGDDFSQLIRFRDKVSGEYQDLTDYDIKCEVRRRTDNALVLSFAGGDEFGSIVIQDDPTYAALIVPKDKTKLLLFGDHLFDLQVTKSGFRRTPVGGPFIISNTISQ